MRRNERPARLSRRFAGLDRLALAFLILLVSTSSWAIPVPYGSGRLVAGGVAGASSLWAGDVDGDGDADLAGTSSDDSIVLWFENVSGTGTSWTSHDVDDAFAGAYALHGADIDCDGDVDLAGASYFGGEIAWFENTSGDGTVWVRRAVASGFVSASAVRASDIDGDGDTDLAGASQWLGRLTWWENTDGSGASWSAHVIANGFDGAAAVRCADMDGDGDTDVLGAAEDGDRVAWFENTDGSGTAWTAHAIDDALDGAGSVAAADLDGDGDLDVPAAGFDGGDVAWYENLGGAASWTRHDLTGSFPGAISVEAADVDHDGDVDVIAASQGGNQVRWWENLGSASSFGLRALVPYFNGVHAVTATDVDGDGHLDLAAAALAAGEVRWWRNLTLHRSAVFPTPHGIDPAFGAPLSAVALDVDRDGDPDVLGADSQDMDVAWWENDSGAGLSWTRHLVDGNVLSVIRVAGGDIDGDGDPDVVAAGQVAGIVWWANLDGSGGAWLLHNIGAAASGAVDAELCDVDCDGDLDVLFAATWDNDVAWFENDAGDGTAWTRRDIDTNLGGARDVVCGDIDGDGAVDVAAAASTGDSIGWWKNLDGLGHTWQAGNVAAGFDGARGVNIADLDRDGSLDLVGGTFDGGDVAWWNNAAGDGSAWNRHDIVSSGMAVSSIDVADLDGDGDIDVMAAFGVDDVAAWFENTAGDGSAWAERTAFTGQDNVSSAVAADMDRDGDPDLLASVTGTGEVAWWENRGGQFALPTTGTAAQDVVTGAQAAVLRVTMEHRGRTGDRDEELSSLDLQFDESPGVPLSTAEANALIDAVVVYADDGSGTFDPGADTLVFTLDTLSLNQGRQRLVLPDGGPALRVPWGSQQDFFVVVNLTLDAVLQTPNQFQVTHVSAQSSTADDRDYDIGLSLEYASDVTSGLVTAVPGADLVVTKTAVPDTVLAGAAVTYTVTVTNRGPVPVTAAAVTDDIPAGVAGWSWTCAGQGGGTCAPSGTGDIDDTVNLPVSASVIYTVQATVITRDDVRNRAAVEPPPATPDPDETDNTATVVNTAKRMFFPVVLEE